MSEEQTNIGIKEKKENSIFRKFLRGILFMLLFFAIIGVSLIVLSQFRFFRNFALEQILTFANDELIADVEIDDLTFFDLQGIKLTGVRLITDGDTLANVSELTLDFNFLPLLDQKVSINRLILKDANVRLLRNTIDSLWNYDKIAPAGDSSSSEPADWTIDVKRLSFRNSNFIMYDSTIPYINYSMMDYDHLDVRNFDMDLKANIKLLTNDFYAKIYNLDAFENNARINVKELSTELILNPNIISAKDFSAKLNDSEFDIDIEMTNYDVFADDEPDIEEAKFKLYASGENIDNSIIHKFADISLEFGKTADAVISANGTLRDMNVEALQLITGDSKVLIAGNLKELLDMDKFKYEFNLDKSNFYRSDIIEVLSNLELDDIPEFNSAFANKLYVNGNIDSVFSNFDINSKIGYLSGSAGINYSRVIMNYFAQVEFENLNISQLTKQVELEGKLNGSLIAQGSGVNLDELKIDLKTKLNNSQLFDFQIKDLITVLKLEEKRLNIDTLFLGLPRFRNNDSNEIFQVYDKQSRYINLSGDLDLNEEDNPKYNLDIEFNRVNLSHILNDRILPRYITGDFKINASGVELDDLQGSIYSNINELGYRDRAFFPFELNIDLENDSDNFRKLNVKSDLVDMNIEGNYNFEDLFDGLALQTNYMAEFVSQKVNSFNPKRLIIQDSIVKVKTIENISKFPNLNAKIMLNIKDLSPINLFLDSMDIYSEVFFQADISSNNNRSNIKIDTLRLNDFFLKIDDFQLKTTEMEFNTSLITSLLDSVPKIDDFAIKTNNAQLLQVNNLLLDSLATDLSFDGKDLNYKLSSKINDDLRLSSDGNLEIEDSFLKLNSDYLKLDYRNLLTWKNSQNIKITSSLDGLNIEQFEFYRDSAETISLKGAINNDRAENIQLRISDLPARDYLPFAGESVNQELKDIIFRLDSLNIDMSGDLESPTIIAKINADSLVFSDYKIGNLSGKLTHKDKFIKGNFDIITPILSNKRTLRFDVNYLPIYLGTNSNIPFMDPKKSMDIRLSAFGMPLELVKPFASGLSELSGFADANIVVEGNLDDGISYSGKAISAKTKLRVENTNIAYNAELDVDFNKDKVTLSKVLLRNIPQDERFGRLGKAEVTGTVALDGFEIGELDIYALADRLLVMSDATMVTMPDLYGDFIMSTDNSPLRFYGTLKKPNLEGNVNINYAHLKMPMETRKSMVRTFLTYKQIGDTVRVQSITQRDSVENTNGKGDKTEGLAPSIADLINYNLSAKILGQFIVEMDMNLIGSMYAVIGTSDKSRSLRYEKNRNESEGKLFGEVVVKEQSTIKSWKQFTTGGVINFPTGSIENPLLDLSATHTGTMTEDGVRKQFIVKMFITGFKENPKVIFKYYIDQVEATGSQEQINEDALYLLTLGRTKSGSGANMNNSILNEGFASGVSNFATKALSDLLIGTGVIQSAEFDFQGGSMNLEDATLRLSGQLYGGISWTVGGNVSDFSSNNQITIDIPASEFSNNPFWSNFVLQLSKASNNNVLANSQDAKNWEVKVKLGSSW